MSDLTEVTKVTNEEVAKWYNTKRRLGKLKGEEAMMRMRIFKYFFPNPTEGSKDNKHPMNDGTGAILQADHKINRSVDESELESLKEAMFAEGSNLPQLDLTQLIKWKPEVNITEYRKLSKSEQAVFDRCLVVKDGMPEMDVKIPKRGS